MILGASFDTPEDNRKFREKYSYPFPLLCDTTHELGVAYGACEDASAAFPQRITVVIDPAGKVQKVYPAVQPKKHAEEILADLGAGS